MTGAKVTRDHEQPPESPRADAARAMDRSESSDDPTPHPPLPERIALIGPRGSGKTTIARRLAEHLSWQWIDADDVLERRAGRSVRAIFAEEGETGFRDREAAVLRELCALPRHVIATGGGAVLREDNRNLLRMSARVVLLSADADTLWSRMIGDADTPERRPALLGGGREEVEEILRRREALYRSCAHWTVSTAGRTVEQVIAEIVAIPGAGQQHPNPRRD
jgi:shikimate kinase